MDASGTCRRPDPAELTARLHAAVVALLAPHADRLAHDPDTAATHVIAHAFGTAFVAASGAPLSDAAAADVLLHGLAKEN